LILVALFVFVFIGIVLIISLFWRYWRLRRQDAVCLEMIPPAFFDQNPEATEKFFVVLHGLTMPSSWRERFFKSRINLTLEVVSMPRNGIRFIVYLPREYLEPFRQAVQTYMPDVELRIIKDYLSTELPNTARFFFFLLRRHFAYPLNTHTVLKKHDPISYVMSVMSKLEKGELIGMQFVITATRPRAAVRLKDKIISGKADTISTPRARGFFFRACLATIHFTIAMLELMLQLISEIATGRQSHASVQRKKSITSPATQALLASVNAKLSRPLFRADVRAIIAVKEKSLLTQRQRGLMAALATYQVTDYQGLELTSIRGQHYKRWLYRFRLPSIKRTFLSSGELAALYHFPDSRSVKNSDIHKSLSKTLPVPLNMRRRTHNDVVLGENRYQGRVTPIGLTNDERQRHVFIVGGTGNGKTTMIEYGIIQDIRAGKGAALIDPHGDSAQKLLAYIPPKRIKDVVYLNPRDLDRPIGLNLLELSPDLVGSELAHEKELITEAVISVFRKIFEDSVESSAFRIERILRNAIYTALTLEDPTVFTVLRLLTDSTYRRRVVRGLDDERLKRFWQEELGRAGEYQRVKMSAGPITRIERFEHSESARRMLNQVHSTLNFDEILNSGKILICNFSKGQLGEDTAALFGMTVLAKIQLAAWRRDSMPETQRRPFYLYVDEFQNFANQHVIELLSQARKYKVFLALAQQSVFQLKDHSLINTMLDNIGTLIVFRSKSIDTEQLLLPQFRPYLDSGDIGNLPSYDFYAKITATVPQEPMSGRTIRLKRHGNVNRAQEVIQVSREHYGRAYVETSVPTVPVQSVWREVPETRVPRKKIHLGH
jgi:hypothetical protein